MEESVFVGTNGRPQWLSTETRNLLLSTCQALGPQGPSTIDSCAVDGSDLVYERIHLIGSKPQLSQPWPEWGNSLGMASITRHSLRHGKSRTSSINDDCAQALISTLFECLTSLGFLCPALSSSSPSLSVPACTFVCICVCHSA